MFIAMWFLLVVSVSCLIASILVLKKVNAICKKIFETTDNINAGEMRRSLYGHP